MSSIYDLPVELLDKIIQKLPRDDKLNARLVCKTLDAVVCVGITFVPVLTKETAENVNSFFIQTVRRNCSELAVGKVGSTDLQWLTSSKLENIRTISIEQSENSDNKNIALVIGRAEDLEQLIFRYFEFNTHLLKDMMINNQFRDVCQRVSALVLKSTPNWRDLPLNNGPSAARRRPCLDCSDFADFTHLESLQLLRMEYITIVKIEMLPTTITDLRLSCRPISRPLLKMLAKRMVNLKRLWMHSDFVNINPGFDDQSALIDVPLDAETLELFLTTNTKLKDFHYIPILEDIAYRHISFINLHNNGLIRRDFLYSARHQNLILRRKRQITQN